MDLNNPVILLCTEGAKAEFEGRDGDARSLYEQAWDTARDDYEACIAAHYVARVQVDPHEALHWNQVALDRAEALERDRPDERVRDFYPSLYLSLGFALERLGRQAEAQHYYDRSAALGYPHRRE